METTSKMEECIDESAAGIPSIHLRLALPQPKIVKLGKVTVIARSRGSWAAVSGFAACVFMAPTTLCEGVEKP